MCIKIQCAYGEERDTLYEDLVVWWQHNKSEWSCERSATGFQQKDLFICSKNVQSFIQNDSYYHRYDTRPSQTSRVTNKHAYSFKMKSREKRMHFMVAHVMMNKKLTENLDKHTERVREGTYTAQYPD